MLCTFRQGNNASHHVRVIKTETGGTTTRLDLEEATTVDEATTVECRRHGLGCRTQDLTPSAETKTESSNIIRQNKH